MSQEAWIWATDTTGTWKPHIIPLALMSKLARDFETRHPEHQAAFETEPREDVMVDLPGMIWLGRSYRSVDVGGLKFEVPSQDWSTILFDLKMKPLRTFEDGTPYYKLHHRYFCVVFTQAQRDALVAAMEAQENEADAEAEHDNKKFLEAIDGINKDGVRVLSARAEMIREAQKGPAGKN